MPKASAIAPIMALWFIVPKKGVYPLQAPFIERRPEFFVNVHGAPGPCHSTTRFGKDLLGQGLIEHLQELFDWIAMANWELPVKLGGPFSGG